MLICFVVCNLKFNRLIQSACLAMSRNNNKNVIGGRIELEQVRRHATDVMRQDEKIVAKLPATLT